MIWFVIGGVAIFCIVILSYIFWVNKNYGRLMFENNERACSLATKALQTSIVGHIHTDSEHGIKIKRLKELMVISPKKREEVQLFSLQDKKRSKVLAGELSKITSEMIKIMEETIFSDTLFFDKNLAKKLAKLG